jgi:hemerythrin-like domain-containing protein
MLSVLAARGSVCRSERITPVEDAMMPIGPLMIEHRLIERMLAGVRSRLPLWRVGAPLDVAYLGAVIDFIHTYADHCHHGKEEDILFKQLLMKNPPAKMAEATRRLIAEHAWARQTVGQLDVHVHAYAAALAVTDTAGVEEAADGVSGSLEALLDFYPRHISFEDKEYFKPAMTYFSPEEQEAMLAEFQEFDRRLIHEHYRGVVDRMEEGA